MIDEELTPEEYKRTFLACVNDAVSNLFYYDRKGCEELSVAQLDKLIDDGNIGLNEIVEAFRKEIKENFPQIRD